MSPTCSMEYSRDPACNIVKNGVRPQERNTGYVHRLASWESSLTYMWHQLRNAARVREALRDCVHSIQCEKLWNCAMDDKDVCLEKCRLYRKHWLNSLIVYRHLPLLDMGSMSMHSSPSLPGMAKNSEPGG